MVIGSGKKNFLDIQKGYIAQLLHNLKDFSKLFKKKNGKNMGAKLSLNNIEEIYDHIVQIYYNNIKAPGRCGLAYSDAGTRAQLAQR